MSTHGAKLLSLILAGACALLFLVALALQLGLGRGYTWLPLEADADNNSIAAVTIDRTPFKLASESTYAPTQARPLFNEDRKATPDEPDESVAPPPSVPLNVALTGIILTPDLHLAMVQDKAKNTAVALKEGMPMPGDQGGWTLTKINSRSAIFRETSGDEVEVELSVAVANPKAAAPGHPAAAAGSTARVAPNPPVAAPNPAGTNPPAPVAPAVGSGQLNQEALQRRIEERRKQMREEAERMKQQHATPEPTREDAQRNSQPQQQ